MNIELQHAMLDALRRLTHPMADDRDREDALRLIQKVEQDLGIGDAGWWGLYCVNVHGDLEILRDSETGEPSVYLDFDDAMDECRAINEGTESEDYYVRECDRAGNIEGGPENVFA